LRFNIILQNDPKMIVAGSALVEGGNGARLRAPVVRFDAPEEMQ
jgi:hypothetical protein